MIIEQRNYTMKVGEAPAYLKTYGDEGLPIQKEYLGTYIGTFVAEIGPLNRVTHMWAYESLDDRMQRRAALGADDRWKDVSARTRAHIEKQENLILLPAPFSPPIG